MGRGYGAICRRICAPVFLIVAASCGGNKPADCPQQPAAGPATVEEAARFVDEVEAELKRLWIVRERAGWVKSNFVTMDTEEMAAEADEAVMAYLAKVIKEATRFDGLELDPVLRRKLTLLKIAGTLPAPSDPQKTKELATVTSSMQSRYSKGRHCPEQGGALRAELTKQAEAADPKDEKLLEALKCEPKAPGVTLDVLTRFMAKSRVEPALREAWVGWHKVAPPMRKEYQRYVELGNEGAREIGFADVGELWRAGYDMSGEEFRAETERLFEQMKPLYEELHCYTRKRLAETYGKELVKPGAPIPAHLLGNMWSQSWSNVYDLLEPFPGEAQVDVTKSLEAQKWDAIRMAKTAEGFFTSLGLDPLPPTFWERSLFVRPADRDVECHASAWDVHFNDDLRIKMCIQITDDDLMVLHHELGHNYYFHYYKDLPPLFLNGANDGFHEAIGDAIALSATPGYMKQIGLLTEVPNNDKADTNYLLRMALDKVAFVPFGKLIDQWRWDVFAGKVAPDRYNGGWWDLRTRYQGIVPPVARSESDFDPGAKYHVPGNVPYIRYFLAFVYQFQFYRALCRVAGHQGPLHKCSIYGNKQAGDRLRALLAMGASRPWQEALEAMTGEKTADASAVLEYFAPLRGWLKQQTAGEKCGW
jgi:peptidyl-dipeptidase A